jgi:hypothetical protein
MFVRDSSAAAEPPPLSAVLPMHGERPTCRTDPKLANGTADVTVVLKDNRFLG